MSILHSYMDKYLDRVLVWQILTQINLVDTVLLPTSDGNSL